MGFMPFSRSHLSGVGVLTGIDQIPGDLPELDVEVLGSSTQNDERRFRGDPSRSMRIPIAWPIVSRLPRAVWKLAARRSSSSWEWATERARLAIDTNMAALARPSTPKAAG